MDNNETTLDSPEENNLIPNEELIEQDSSAIPDVDKQTLAILKNYKESLSPEVIKEMNDIHSIIDKDPTFKLKQSSVSDFLKNSGSSLSATMARTILTEQFGQLRSSLFGLDNMATQASVSAKSNIIDNYATNSLTKMIATTAAATLSDITKNTAYNVAFRIDNYSTSLEKFKNQFEIPIYEYYQNHLSVLDAFIQKNSLTDRLKTPLSIVGNFYSATEVARTLVDSFPVSYTRNIIDELNSNNDFFSTLSTPLTSELSKISPSIELFALSKEYEHKLDASSSLINQALHNLNPAEQIRYLQNSKINILPSDLELFKDSYANIPENSTISLNVENMRIIPKIKGEGFEYPLASQPIVHNVTTCFTGISEHELMSFVSYLQRYPMLGLKHKTGRKIYSELGKILRTYKNSTDFVTIPKGTTFYRCRVWEQGRDHNFTINEMYKPSFGISEMARFNSSGVNLLYLTESKETAQKEVNAPNPTKNTILQTKISKELRLFEISRGKNQVFNYCLFQKTDNSGKAPMEYLVPNYISQCCLEIIKRKQYAIDGIKYSSVHSQEEFSYVLFHADENSFHMANIIFD